MPRTGRPKKTDRRDVADCSLTIRVTAIERDFLNQLARLRQEELGGDARVTQTLYLRSLIRREAQEKGLKPSKPPK